MVVNINSPAIRLTARFWLPGSLDLVTFFYWHSDSLLVITDQSEESREQAISVVRALYLVKKFYFQEKANFWILSS